MPEDTIRVRIVRHTEIDLRRLAALTLRLVRERKHEPASPPTDSAPEARYE